MTKLLISLPLSDRAQKYYGSNAPTYNKVGDAGIDLPFVSDVQPYDAEVVETIGVISFETVFAMYDSRGAINDIELWKNLPCLKLILSGELALKPCHFDIRPRSSIGKSPFRLANCVGTIDKSYCGVQEEEYHESLYWTGDTLGCYLDYHPQLGAKPRKPFITAGDRLLQIVAPSLDDILHIKLDYTEENCRFWSTTISNKNRDGFGSSGQ